MSILTLLFWFPFIAFWIWLIGSHFRSERDRYLAERAHVPAARLQWKWPRLLLGLLLMSAGTVSCLGAVGTLTPRSESVSGYTRQNGTQVSSYNRRPSGSAAGDTGNGLGQLIGGVLFLVGLFTAVPATPYGQV